MRNHFVRKISFEIYFCRSKIIKKKETDNAVLASERIANYKVVRRTKFYLI